MPAADPAAIIASLPPLTFAPATEAPVSDQWCLVAPADDEWSLAVKSEAGSTPTAHISTSRWCTRPCRRRRAATARA